MLEITPLALLRARSPDLSLIRGDAPRYADRSILRKPLAWLTGSVPMAPGPEGVTDRVRLVRPSTVPAPAQVQSSLRLRQLQQAALEGDENAPGDLYREFGLSSEEQGR